MGFTWSADFEMTQDIPMPSIVDPSQEDLPPLPKADFRTFAHDSEPDDPTLWFSVATYRAGQREAVAAALARQAVEPSEWLVKARRLVDAHARLFGELRAKPFGHPNDEADLRTARSALEAHLASHPAAVVESAAVQPTDDLAAYRVWEQAPRTETGKLRCLDARGAWQAACEWMRSLAPPQQAQAERGRCAQICDDFAEMMERGAGEMEVGERFRQAARKIRSGEAPLALAEASQPPPPLNQCDGCRVNAPTTDLGNHQMPDGGLMGCTADRYVQPSAPEPLSMSMFASRTDYDAAALAAQAAPTEFEDRVEELIIPWLDVSSNTAGMTPTERVLSAVVDMKRDALLGRAAARAAQHPQPSTSAEMDRLAGEVIQCYYDGCEAWVKVMQIGRAEHKHGDLANKAFFATLKALVAAATQEQAVQVVARLLRVHEDRDEAQAVVIARQMLGAAQEQAVPSVSEEEIIKWADGFIREKAFNRAVAVQIAIEAAKWVAGSNLESVLPVMGGRESVDDALAVVESFGPGIRGLNDTYARQILLADEVKRLRAVPSADAVDAALDQLPTFRAFHQDGRARRGLCVFLADVKRAMDASRAPTKGQGNDH